MADQNPNIYKGKLPKGIKSRKDWARILEWKRTRQPHLHQIEPTNACPYSCIICPRGNT